MLKKSGLDFKTDILGSEPSFKKARKEYIALVEANNK